MKDFIKAINSLFDLFDKLSEADTSPSANYSMAEMFMCRALKGDEKAKKTLAANISYNLNANLKIVEIALDEWLNNKRNIKENTNMNKKLIRLTESDLHRIVKESVNRILRESEDEFNYSDSEDLGKGRHRQTIIYNGKEIGYLVCIEKNWLAPLEERYVLPDIEYGMQSSDGGGLLDGKKGWIDFKVFTNYDEAFRYASQNFEELAYLFEYGDYD